MLSVQAKLGAVTGARVAPFRSNSFCSARRFAKLANARSGAKWTMSGSFLVEVEVGEEEADEMAIRRYQRAVTNTLVINELRRRRRVMTKIEALQAKQNEKGLIKKLNVDPPSWKEWNGDDGEPAPFAEFFGRDEEVADIYSPDKMTDDDEFFDALSDNYPIGSNYNMGTMSAYSPRPMGGY